MSRPADAAPWPADPAPRPTGRHAGPRVTQEEARESFNGARPYTNRPADPIDPTGVYSPNRPAPEPEPRRPERPADIPPAVVPSHVTRQAPHGPARRPGQGQAPPDHHDPGQGSQPPRPSSVFVYRDPASAPVPQPQEKATAEEDSAVRPRGPFEPMARHAEAPQQPPPVEDRQDDTREESPPSAHALDQIKDLYATAEAIGDENVDRHFDELLQRQRELITEYFSQSRAKQDDSAATRVSPE